MSHTKEPWSAQDVSGVGMIHAFDFRANAYPIFSKDSGAIDGQIVYCSPEDARRLVSCVNACAGIPTEALERWGSGGGSALVDKIAANRIAALEAKVRELETSVSWYSGRHEEDDKIIDGLETELTASRQQVERLVAALKKIRGVLWATRDLEIIDEALKAVENCASGDMLLTAATALMFDVRMMRAKIEADRSLTNGEAVRIPTSALEAELMVRLGTQYLREHAPHRLTAETPNVEVTGA